jgi:hypothetical protein
VKRQWEGKLPHKIYNGLVVGATWKQLQQEKGSERLIFPYNLSDAKHSNVDATIRFYAIVSKRTVDFEAYSQRRCCAKF